MRGCYYNKNVLRTVCSNGFCYVFVHDPDDVCRYRWLKNYRNCWKDWRYYPCEGPDDEPAEIWSDNTRQTMRWMKNEKLHRDDGPAVIEKMISIRSWVNDYQPVDNIEIWYHHDQWHNVKGPSAICYLNKKVVNVKFSLHNKRIL